MSRSRTVLMVAGEFPPVKTIGRIRTTKFIKHLATHGWRAVVLTIEPNGTTSTADPSLAAEVPADVPVVRVPHPDLDAALVRQVKRVLRRNAGSPIHESTANGANEPPARAAPAGAMDRMHGLIKRILNDAVYVPDGYRPWARHAVPIAERICREHAVDVVYTTLPPFSAAMIGNRVRRRTGTPWVVDYRDLWTGDVLREWIGPLRRRYETWLERRWIGDADAVVGVSEQKTDYLRALHGRRGIRWETITNGFDAEEFAGLTRRPSHHDGQVTFVFTGRLFKNRQGYAFAEALGRLARMRPDLADRARVRFLGHVAPEIAARYRTILAEHGLQDRFDFAGDVPHEVAKQAQLDADYLLLVVDTGATSDGVIPGKLFEYVSARRPIFALTDPGATAEIIERGRLGRVISVADVAGCQTALAEVLEAPVPDRLVPDEAYLSQFDRQVLTARLAALLDDVADAGRRAQTQD